MPTRSRQVCVHRNKNLCGDVTGGEASFLPVTIRSFQSCASPASEWEYHGRLLGNRFRAVSQVCFWFSLSAVVLENPGVTVNFGCQLSAVLVQQQSPERVSKGSLCELVDWTGKICPQWGRLTPLVETWIKCKGRGIWIVFLFGAGTKELQVFRPLDSGTCIPASWNLTTSPSLVLRSFTTDWAKLSVPLTL